MKGLDNKVYVRILDSEKIIDMVAWCQANVDDKNWDWSYVDDSDLNSDVNFYFLDPATATLFGLKWA